MLVNLTREYYSTNSDGGCISGMALGCCNTQNHGVQNVLCLATHISKYMGIVLNYCQYGVLYLGSYYNTGPYINFPHFGNSNLGKPPHAKPIRLAQPLRGPDLTKLLRHAGPAHGNIEALLGFV